MKTENRDNSRSVINWLKQDNQDLTQQRNTLVNKNMILSQELAYFKELCVELEDQVNSLERENQRLQNRLNNVSLWDLSEDEQERAGRALARSLLGGA